MYKKRGYLDPLPNYIILSRDGILMKLVNLMLRFMFSCV
jgi:hypothetical protein